MGNYIKGGILFVIAALANRILDVIFDFSAMLLPDFTIMRLSDIIMILGLSIGGILLFFGFRNTSKVERIERIQAYIFFPKGLNKADKTLVYHQKHFNKKVIVDYKPKIPQAYPLPASETSYSWKLINQYPDLWVSVEDSNLEIDDWCKEKGYNFNSWSPSKKALKNSILTESISALSDHELDGYTLAYLYPWYTFTLNCLEKYLYPSKKRVLVKGKQAFDPFYGDIECAEACKLHTTSFTRKPFESISDCLKRHNIEFIREQCPDPVLKKIAQMPNLI